MTSEGYFASAEWGWVGEEFPQGIRLMFVRAVPPERIIEALEADPADARWLTAEATYETLVQPFARVGRTDDWAFCIDDCLFNIGGFSPTAAQLSTGTELALLDSLGTSGYFWYFIDGVEVTSFEPLLSAWRNGTDPDRFVPQMRQVGLDVEPLPDDADPVLQRDPDIAALDMLTLALGIRLSRETATGPLLTVRPGCGGG